MINTTVGEWCPKEKWGTVERNKKANQRDKRDTEWEKTKGNPQMTQIGK
jgi:hypothetical protein